MGPKARASQRLRGKRLRSLPATVPEENDVTVALLTGGRPALLARTLGALERSLGVRLSKWAAVALINGGDNESLQVLRRHPWIKPEPRPGKVRPIGSALSSLMELAVGTERSYVLHLEDDWDCSDSGDWLDRGAHILATDAGVGQVRLRSAREKVMKVSMRTGARIRWASAPDHRRSSNAHLTFNPNLMRTQDVSRIYPVAGELDAQAKFAALDLDVVQLLPGAFRHMGDTDSLRLALRRGH